MATNSVDHSSPVARMTTAGEPLLAPLRIGRLVLPNGIFMAPLTRCRATDDHVPTRIMADYYAQRAGAGLIVSEATFVSPQGRGYPNAPGIYNVAQRDAWKVVTQAVHGAGGRIFAQLWHVGRVSHPSYYDGELPVAPSAIATTDGMALTTAGRRPFPVPRELASKEIAGIVGDYASAARNACAAGFDGVEIHAANGFLIDQFLRDGSNRRTDLYGGTVENRARFLGEIASAIAQSIGADRVGVRISPTGTYNSMSDSDPAATFSYVARDLDRLNLAYLHVVEAWGGDLRRHAQNLDLCLLRSSFAGVLVVNADYDFARGNAVLESGLADAVAFGRPFIANPDLVARFEAGLPLNRADEATFYSGGRAGYIDYPVATAARRAFSI